ncbi:ribonuclease H-like domain-containing protein [Candidatus Giovannonibacteria bacterium]|nr:ribonuclease H-like domain-containing protein [Candidatus Giovannonibacteria bacterium]
MADTIVFDLETKRDFAEVGGRENLEKLEVSVLCAYSYLADKFYAFEEKDLPSFEKMLGAAGRVVGFNIKGFDLPVLAPYLKLNLTALPVLDMMDDVVEGVGFRVSLDNLCQTTLGAAKSAHGLDAVKWYREGKMEEIKKYCTDDVRLTRDLYEFGRKNGHVLFLSRDAAGRIAIPVRWSFEIPQNVRQVLSEALQKKFSVEIDYVTRSSDSLAAARNARLVDIYKLDDDFFEGYCHLRKSPRIFKIERVLAARLTTLPYELPGEAQTKLL